MAAFVRGTGGVAFNGTSSTIPPSSGGGLVGDVRYIYAGSNAQGITGPSGWTQLLNVADANGSMGLWWKPLDAAEPTVFLNLSSSADVVVIVVALAAASTTGTPQAVANTGSSTTLTASSLTPSVTNDVELAFFSSELNSNATTATLSTPSGMTASPVYHGSVTTGQIGMVAYRQLTSTAATGTSTSTASTTGRWRTATALHPPGPVVSGSQPGEFMGFFGGGL